MRHELVLLLMASGAVIHCVPQENAPIATEVDGGSTSVGGVPEATGGLRAGGGSPVSTDTGGAGGAPAPPSPDCTDSPHVSVVKDCENGMCRIPAGCFLMGRNPDEYPSGVFADEALVEVTLTRSFFIGQHEITIAEWQKAGHPVPKGLPDSGTNGCYEPNCPVDHLSWYEAAAYANWRSEQEGLAPCFDLQGCSGTMGVDFVCEGFALSAESVYACEGYRLPTEAEWEYAARAGTRTTFYSGEITPHERVGACREDPDLDPISWYCFNSEDRAHPVGEKKPNGWGLYDVLGNLGEWLYDGGYSHRPEGPHTDPIIRVARLAGRAGGFYSMDAVLHRAANRMSGFLDNARRFPSYGFRLARTDHSSAGAGGANGGGP